MASVTDSGSALSPVGQTGRFGVEWFRTDRGTAILWGVIALALLPLWYTYFYWSWKDGHYQYFPLLLGTVAVLYLKRSADAVRHATLPSRRACLIAMALFAVFVTVALLLFGPFLAILSIIAAVLLATYGLFGWAGVWRLSPVLALLLLAIPLPLGLDNSLIFQMQLVASQLASLLLDGAGVRHVREGALLITEQSRYMTEEACSGVRSLFSSLAVISVYGVVARHHLVRVAINLCQAIVWVLIGNAIRVAVCVYLADNVSPWYASGAGHEVLSMVIFAFILAMVINTDATLAMIIPSRWGWYLSEDDLSWQRGDDETTMTMPNISPATHRLVWSRGVVPVGAAAGGLGVGRGSSKTRGVTERDQERDQEKDHEQEKGRRIDETGSGNRSGSRGVAWAFTAGFAFLFLLGGFVFVNRRSAQAPKTVGDQRLPALTVNDLPASLDGWTRVGFEHVTREPNDLLANESYTWRMQRGELKAIVSVDCPWSSWHNLDICYRAIGWNSQPSYFDATPTDEPYPNLTFSELALSRTQSSASGRVLFTVVDRERDDVTANIYRDDLTDVGGVLKGLLLQMAGSIGITDEAVTKLPATTIQLFSDHAEPYTDEELAQIRSLFFEVRQTLLDGRRWQPSATSDESPDASDVPAASAASDAGPSFTTVSSGTQS